MSKVCVAAEYLPPKPPFLLDLALIEMLPMTIGDSRPRHLSSPRKCQRRTWLEGGHRNIPPGREMARAPTACKHLCHSSMSSAPKSTRSLKTFRARSFETLSPVLDDRNVRSSCTKSRIWDKSVRGRGWRSIKVYIERANIRSAHEHNLNLRCKIETHCVSFER